jgi:mevalonate kinase
MGCGMGSSAALVMSTLYALAHFFKLEIDPTRFLTLGREAENLQHGYSSGLDLHLTLNGGCLRFQEGRVFKRNACNLPMTIVQTGIPEATTGQCVSFVAKHFKKTTIGEDFAAVTECFDKALENNDIVTIQDCIRNNYRLLVKIGVVPLKVQDFVNTIEKEGAAAKICGAGSIVGDKAGVVLIVSQKDLSSIAHNYGYRLQQVNRDLHGTHIV